jgi:hypothetical protein
MSAHLSAKGSKKPLQQLLPNVHFLDSETDLRDTKREGALLEAFEENLRSELLLALQEVIRPRASI